MDHDIDLHSMITTYLDWKPKKKKSFWSTFTLPISQILLSKKAAWQKYKNRKIRKIIAHNFFFNFIFDICRPAKKSEWMSEKKI